MNLSPFRKLAGVLRRFREGDHYDYRRTLTAFTAGFWGTMDVQETYRELVEVLHGSLGCRFVSLWQIQQANVRRVACVGHPAVDQEEFVFPDAARHALLSCPILEKGALDPHLPGAIAEWFECRAVQLIVPLVVNQELKGLVAIGDRQAPYTAEDRDLMLNLATQVAVAAHTTDLMDRAVALRVDQKVAESMAEQRRLLIQQIAHDLRNALNVIALATEDLFDRLGEQDPTVARSLRHIDKYVTFIDEMLRERLKWAKLGASEETSCRLGEVISEIAKLYAFKCSSKGQLLEVSVPHGEVMVSLSRSRLLQVLGQSLDNAHQVSPPGSRIRLWSEISDNWITLNIGDEGPGPEAIEAQDEDLGLFIVQQLVSTAGGLFGYRTADDGTIFYVTLATGQWGG